MYLFKLQGHTFYFPTRFTSDSEADKLNRIKYCKLFKNFWKELNKIVNFPEYLVKYYLQVVIIKVEKEIIIMVLMELLKI